MCDTGGVVGFRALKYNAQGVQYRWTVYDSAQALVLDTLFTDTAEFNYFMINKGFYDVRLQLIYNGDTATEYKSKAIWVMNCEASIAHEGGNWFFGQYAGLIFTESVTRPGLDAYDFRPNSIYTTEGGISLSDSLGNLMFYGGGQSYFASDGRLFNKNHAPINNRFTQQLKINGNAAQNTIAFPCPFDEGKMMIVQNNAWGKGLLSYTLLKKV